MDAPTLSTDDESSAVKCGVFSLTRAAEFTLHTLELPLRITAPQLRDQLGEFQQIGHAEERPLRTDEDLRIRRYEICPLRWNRAGRHLINVQQEPSAISGIPLAHARELLAAERMEWVRDAHKTRRCDCNTCILD
jgi:hypothetical protein